MAYPPALPSHSPEEMYASISSADSLLKRTVVSLSLSRSDPSGARSDAAWGLGFQVGAYYENPGNGIHLGVSLKSPQWLQAYKFNSQDELGAGRSFEFNLDYPLILSLGAGYSGIDRWKFAADVRYIDYANTDGFEPTGFDATGATKSLERRGY